MLFAGCLLELAIGVACGDVAPGKDDLYSQAGILKGMAFSVNNARLGRTPAEQFAPTSAD